MLATEFKILENKYGQYALADDINISEGCPVVKQLEVGRVWEPATVDFVSKNRCLNKLRLIIQFEGPGRFNEAC